MLPMISRELTRKPLIKEAKIIPMEKKIRANPHTFFMAQTSFETFLMTCYINMY